jgi:hypothetical protein
VAFLLGTFDGIKDAIHGKNVSQSLLRQVLHMSIPPVLATVFGMASWAIWREKDSARAWTIAACLANLAISIGVPLRFFYYLRGAGAFWQMVYIFALPTVIGVAGLFFFSPPEKQSQASAKAHENSSGGRMPFAGIFGLTSLGCLWGAVYIIYRHHAALPLRVQIGLAFFLALALIFGAAWWNIWMEKPSADAWGLAASLIYALMFLGETIYSWPPDLAHNLAHNGDWLFKNVGGLFVGTLGVAIFSQHFRQDESIEYRSVPADHLSGNPNP